MKRSTIKLKKGTPPHPPESDFLVLSSALELEFAC